MIRRHRGPPVDGASNATRLPLATDAAQSADWPTAQREAARRQPELHKENIPYDPGEHDGMPIAAATRSDLQESACRAGPRATDRTPSVALSTSPRTRVERQPRPRRGSYPCTTAHRDRKSPRQSPHAPTRPSDRGDETGSAAPYAPATTPCQPSRPSGTPVSAADPAPPARRRSAAETQSGGGATDHQQRLPPEEERIASSPAPFP